METVDGAIMREIKFRLCFDDTELDRISKIINDISQTYYPWILEVISVDSEDSLLFIETRALELESCGMFYPNGASPNFVIDTKNNKWGTFKEMKPRKVYHWDKRLH